MEEEKNAKVRFVRSYIPDASIDVDPTFGCVASSELCMGLVPVPNV